MLKNLTTPKIKRSSVEDLCKLADIPHRSIKETVFFGHGEGHKVLDSSGVGMFYVDLDQIQGTSKAERERDALYVLARLGSSEARQSLIDANLLALDGRLRSGLADYEEAACLAVDLPTERHSTAMLGLIEACRAELSVTDYKQMVHDVQAPYLERTAQTPRTFEFKPEYADVLISKSDEIAEKLWDEAPDAKPWEYFGPNMLEDLSKRIKADQHRLKMIASMER
jgi:hypothetical protein